GIIRNPLYFGKVRYAGQIYDGQQEAIIDEETFKKTQDMLKQNRQLRKATKNIECTGLLSHILHCKICGKFMFHTYTLKNSKHKYRYYVCSNAQKRGYHSCPTKSANAQAIEDATIDCLKRIFADKNPAEKNTEIEALLSPVWETLYPEEKRRILKTLIKEVDYDSTSKKLGIILTDSDTRLEFEVDLKQVRPLNKWHKEKEIEKEPNIRRNLILAYQLQMLIDEGTIASPKQAAQWLNMIEVRINQIMNMLFLSPIIQEEIICSENKAISLIPEYKLRPVTNEADWHKQNQMWQELLKISA
ncbi:MAG: recombinase zinc beta ribbon domain-containing protein, partial [Candidatus Omnitrophota bacterium]